MRTIMLAAAALLLAPAAADAHVLVIPETAPQGAEMRLDVRVPNERDDAATTKVDLQLPPGFAEASYQPVPGWNVKVTHVKLNPPVQTDDGPITEGVGRITWTAKSKADGIPVGGFQDFGLEVLIPGKAGSTLTFKALQTYGNGTVVRWIGAKDSDTPAPTVKVTSASGEAAATPTATPTPTATATPAAASSGGGSSNGLAVTALIVGALGLITGALGLLAARRARVRA
jgi:periplasmic copper chaperone A